MLVPFGKPRIVKARHGGVHDDGRPVLWFWRRALAHLYIRYLALGMRHQGHHRAARIMRQWTCDNPSRDAILNARTRFIQRWPG